MQGWRRAIFLLSIVACSSDRTGPGDTPDVPALLSTTTLDGAVALTWSDNSYTADPGNFQNYRVYSTSFDIAGGQCGTTWQLEGTTVAPEFLVGALTNGISRCFAVSAVGQGGGESARSTAEHDTPRPDARNVALFARQVQNAGSGFRFWKDGNGDNQVQANEVGLVLEGSDPTIDFSVERDGSGSMFLTPVRPGTGVEFYSDLPVEDLTSVDVAACLPSSDPSVCAAYATTPIEASPGFAYVFEMEAGDAFLRYGALRVTHVGQTFIIVDWAYQTDPGNPELLVGGRAGNASGAK
jgi:hypothetical protein